MEKSNSCRAETDDKNNTAISRGKRLDAIRDKKARYLDNKKLKQEDK
jgi:hypothetical protein